MMFVMNHRAIGALVLCLAVTAVPGVALAQQDGGRSDGQQSADVADASIAGPVSTEPLVFAVTMAALTEQCGNPGIGQTIPGFIQSYCNGTQTTGLNVTELRRVLALLPPPLRSRDDRPRSASQTGEARPELSGSGSVTDIILRGLTQFLWSRVQAEVQRIAQEGLRSLLSNASPTRTNDGGLFDYLQGRPCAVLPATCALLGLDTSGIRAAASDDPERDGGSTTSTLQSLSSVGEALRNALARDVVSLPRNLDRVMSAEPALARNPDMMPLRLALSLGLAISESVAPGQIVARLRARLLDATDQDSRRLSEALDVFEAIALAQDNRREGEITDFANRELLTLLESLRASWASRTPADANAVQSNSPSTAIDGGATNSDIARALLLLRELDRTVASVHRSATTLADQDLNDAERVSRVVPVVRGVTSAIRSALQIHDLLAPTADRLPEVRRSSDRIERFMRGAAELPEIYDALARRDLPRFLATTLALIETLQPQLPSGNAPDASVSPADAAAPLRSLSSNVRRALVFAAELASATDADAASRVFETLSMPPGSWEVQAQRPMTTLSAYVGLGGGYSHDFMSTSRSSIIGQVTLMLGVDWTWPIPACRGWFGGLYVPIVDVGTLLSFEPSPSPTERSVTEQPLRVLAPGIFGHINYRVISLMVGASLVPFSRNEEWSPTVRFMGAISFGFPLFAL
ncbi:MAG: hypothetical protein Q8S73_17880 [Deltaproteobacteria bacterium]|nr:hypothetical protein [Myxococcales bacterium]MDP3215982.1 hypothetical protein [Deltaproteobacteria bacterium]